MNFFRKLFGAGGGVQESSRPGTPVTVDEINRVLPALGTLIERHADYGIAVFDEAALPGRKSRLEKVLLTALARAGDDAQVSVLSVALVSLAQYQPNVGPEPVTMLPVLPDPSPLPDSKDISALARLVAAHAESSRYDAFKPAIATDEARLGELADAAVANWRRARRARR